jgi:hypothetical protein
LNHLPFQFEIPVSFFEKAEAGPKGKRIGGIISTENPDRQGEVILQRGLDFDDFLKHGWFNDNHSKQTDGILGYPDSVKAFKKGETLPDGSIAKANGTWAEGYLLDTEKATKIWDLGLALQKTQRRLGFSVEGKVDARMGPNQRVIAKAKIRNVAITNCPVNTDSRLEVLAKSLMAFEQCEPGLLEKSLGMGTATPGVAIATQGAQTGMGAGRVIAGQSLESDIKDPKKKKKKKVAKSLDDTEAIAWVQTRLPGASVDQARRIVSLTKSLKRTGQI